MRSQSGEVMAFLRFHGYSRRKQIEAVSTKEGRRIRLT